MTASNDPAAVLDAACARIQALTDEQLRDPAYLEHQLIPALGLMPDPRYPRELHGMMPLDGHFKLWQYPVQFAKYLVALTVLRPESYVEIGSATGGTFVLTCEFLRRVHGGPIRAMSADIAPAPPLHALYNERMGYPMVVGDSKGGHARSTFAAAGPFELVLIDGDHSYGGVLSDYLTFAGRAGVIAFHDIANSHFTPTVVQFWHDIARANPGRTFTIIDQYPGPHVKPYLGIGLLVNSGVPDDVVDRLRSTMAQLNPTVSADSKVVVSTPAGRRRYLEILEVYLERAHRAGEFDEWQLWFNTSNADDAKCIDEIVGRNSWASKLSFDGHGVPSLDRVTALWPHAMTEPTTVYVKIDDDIVWIAPGTIGKVVDALLSDARLAVVAPWIVNNTIAAHALQRFGLHSRSVGFIPFEFGDGRGRPDFTAEYHASFLDAAEGDKLEPWLRLPDFVFTEHAQAFGIQFLALRGNDAMTWAADMVQRGIRDEIYMTHTVPAETGRHAKFVGGTMSVHFAYGPQNGHPGLLSAYPRYAKLAGAARQTA